MVDRDKYRRNPRAIEYFNRHIDDFDKIYRKNRSWFGNWLDRTIRASVGLRFDLAFELLGDLKDKSILDVGCGSGRYMFEAVNRGAGKVLGIDAAGGALKAAKEIAAELGVDDRVEFLETDFMDYAPDGRKMAMCHKFHIIFAVGYFDYIFDPVVHLEKMLQLSRGFVYATFPSRWHPLTPVRKTRLALNRCAVRFYSSRQLKKLMSDLKCNDYLLRKVARDYVVLIRK
jgi:SAM-dependent methyltransferase